jgi:hypothetical protein
MNLHHVKLLPAKILSPSHAFQFFCLAVHFVHLGSFNFQKYKMSFWDDKKGAASASSHLVLK